MEGYKKNSAVSEEVWFFNLWQWIYFRKSST